MRLELDVGNTRLKWRVWQGPEESVGGACARAELQELPQLLALDEAPTQVWISSVAGDALEAELGERSQQWWGVEPWFARTRAEALGLLNSYAEPTRMGVDRWLAMLAAWHSTGGACCVVDAGSALTIDFISAAGQHTGGYIIPGLDSMERALLSDTDRVRFGEAPRDRLEPGQATETAVFNGLLLSQAGAVSLALQKYGQGAALFFCGGNGELLRQSLGLEGLLATDLVLDGLALQGHMLHPEAGATA